MMMYLIDTFWSKYHQKNSILDIGMKISKIIGLDVVFAAYDPIDQYTSDWLLAKPSQDIFRVKAIYNDDESFDIDYDDLMRLSNADIQNLLF